MYRREAQGRKDQRLSRRTCAQIAHKLEVERLRYLDSDRPVVSVGGTVSFRQGCMNHPG